MKRGVGVTDVAKHAGVSLGTVSNVLNHPDLVAPATRARVQASIDELGFVRNEAARMLRSGSSRTIGLLVLDVSNPFFTDIAGGVEAAAEDAGLSMMLCNSGESLQREAHYLGLLEEQRCYGILVTPVGDRTPALDGIRKRGIPVVLVDRGSSRKQCSVSVDDVAGGEMAVAHLIEQGHRRIAFVAGPMTIKQVRDRLAGARRAVAAAGLDEDALLVLEFDALNVQNGRAAAAQLMAVADRPTAAFCVNDLLALGVLQEAHRLGFDVPADLALVGYDDIGFAASAAVPLSSVQQPRELLGRAAAELLIEEASHAADHKHRQVVFEPELVVRESSRTALTEVSRRPA